MSQHLEVLKEAGVIRATIEGFRVCYCIEPETMKRLKTLVLGLTGEEKAP